MNESFENILKRFARFGVVHREAVKNDHAALQHLINQGFASKTFRSGRVFYELTEKALPLLECQRRKLLEDARMHAMIDERSAVHRALLDDVRFLNEKNPEARKFLFLGDWQLKKPVFYSQLQLSQLRFYSGHMPRRTRKAA